MQQISETKMMTPKITQAQADCLRAIQEAGSVVLQSHGRVLGAGGFLRFAPETFLRLIGAGLVEFYEPLRMRLTERGEEAAKKGRRRDYAWEPDDE